MNRQSYEHPEALTADDVDILAARLAANGHVVLHDVVPLALIDQARRAFDPLLEAGRKHGTNRGPLRYSLFLPFSAPFDDAMLYANPAIIAVLERVLGDDLALAGMGSDTCEPGADFQPVHGDEPVNLYPEAMGISLPTYAVTVNVPLTEVTLENGPTEFWPGGTHRLPPPARLEQVASGMPSVRATVAPGSVVLRDIRAWHRGTPNRSATPRTLLGFAYTRAWFRYWTVSRPRIPAARWAMLPKLERGLLRFSEVVA
jgi:ectoine hydroxylase-related dioxygenase (phytanoyl-CoA dioxygenase family)